MPSNRHLKSLFGIVFSSTVLQHIYGMFFILPPSIHSTVFVLNGFAYPTSVA